MLKDFFYSLKRKIKKERNIILDTNLSTVSRQDICKIVEVSYINYSGAEFRSWIQNAHLDFNKFSYFHKKGLEFFFTAKILDVKTNDVIMDAAAGKSKYLEALRLTVSCNNLYLNDHIFCGVLEKEDGIRILGGDISSIDLRDESLTKISCHHAIEHFKEDKDMLFVIEISRLLKVGGHACIVPIFLVDKYVECWNVNTNKRFDKDAELLIDKSASLPGGEADGHFARLYSIGSFKKRIIDVANQNRLSCKIYECHIDNNEIPDMNRNHGSCLNSPLRLLKLTKIH